MATFCGRLAECTPGIPGAPKALDGRAVASYSIVHKHKIRARLIVVVAIDIERAISRAISRAIRRTIRGGLSVGPFLPFFRFDYLGSWVDDACRLRRFSASRRAPRREGRLVFFDEEKLVSLYRRNPPAGIRCLLQIPSSYTRTVLYLISKSLSNCRRRGCFGNSKKFF
jgi:hypothetical protein